jgi:hypothetical protein
VFSCWDRPEPLRSVPPIFIDVRTASSVCTPLSYAFTSSPSGPSLKVSGIMVGCSAVVLGKSKGVCAREWRLCSYGVTTYAEVASDNVVDIAEKVPTECTDVPSTLVYVLVSEQTKKKR